MLLGQWSEIKLTNSSTQAKGIGMVNLKCLMGDQRALEWANELKWLVLCVINEAKSIYVVSFEAERESKSASVFLIVI